MLQSALYLILVTRYLGLCTALRNACQELRKTERESVMSMGVPSNHLPPSVGLVHSHSVCEARDAAVMGRTGYMGDACIIAQGMVSVGEP